MTLIAVAISISTPSAVHRALEAAHEAKAQGADVVEWRVDALAQEPAGAEAIAHLVARSPMACVVTLRSDEEGGRFSGSDEERIAAWVASSDAHPSAAYIDVELSTYRARDGIRAVLNRIAHAASPSKDPVRIILSFHNFQGRPPGLSARIAEMWADPTSAIAKVAWTARTVRDNLEAFELLAMRAKPTIALCMGEHGIMSRVLAPKFGGFLTYARTDEEETAPGQLTTRELIDDWNFRAINQHTKVYGVIGHPIAHSRSPAIHNAWFREAQIDARLFPMSVAPSWEAFKATVGEMFGSSILDFYGAAVTIGHKEHAIRFVDESGGRVDARARRIGAANTIGRDDDGALFALNTDADAILDALGCAVSGTRALVLGAGGAARAAVVGLASAGASVVIANRTERRATSVAVELARPADYHAGHHAGELPALDVHAMKLSQLPHERFDIIVNATSAGMDGGGSTDENPLPHEVPLDSHTVVLDAVYAPAMTPLLAHAAQSGARCVGGWEMFLAQARRQFEAWTGSPPRSAGPSSAPSI
ncbi:MAG: type I 3-dehydroquinate dehydratase [Phycisphaerales bacterium]|nr:type I 3-dehydroquinate dehydratase [Phycisphaerales bacterium]